MVKHHNYSELTADKIKYLTEVSLKINEVIGKGTQFIYQWNLEREVKFISAVLSRGEYNIHYDSDRLNSLKNLIGYIDRGDY